jgi:hypothetical protein
MSAETKLPSVRIHTAQRDLRNSDRFYPIVGSLCVADDKPRPDFKDDIELALASGFRAEL